VVPGWLRRLLSPLERRWIRDVDERDRHDRRVRGRLPGHRDGPTATVAADGPPARDTASDIAHD
jgi:hypothetical protein